MRRTQQSGFSLLEIMIVLGIVMVLVVVGLVVIPPALRSMRADTAVTYVQNEIRSARERAINERRQYQLSFIVPPPPRVPYMELLQGDSSSGTLTFTPIDSPDLELPFDMQFGLPASLPAIPPDGYGTQSDPIDFSITGAGGGGTVIYFNPDGSVVDALGGVTIGVVYLIRPDDQGSARAVSLFGATGRVKAWSLVEQPDGSVQWLAH